MKRTITLPWTVAALLLAITSPAMRAATDPAMEPLAAELDTHWAVLRDWWEGKGGDGEVSALLAEEVHCSTPWPDDLEARSLPGGLTVRTWTKTAAPVPAGGPERARSLLALPGDPATRTEVKLIEAREDADTGLVVTQALIGIHRHTDTHRSEIRAHWRGEWKRVDGTLKLQRNELLRYQESRSEAGAPMFADRTTALLPEGSRDDESLTGGNYLWRHRLEAALQADPFGQNGVSIADVNGDGLPDLYLAQLGGLPNRLFVQTASGRCEDRSAPSGLDLLDNTTGSLFADFDNDGDQDVVLATAAGILIYANDGSGRFEQMARFADLPYGFGMAAADADRDGDLDLYICQYYRGADEDDREGEVRGRLPVPFPIYDATNGGRNVYLRNDGELRFTDATAAVGLEKNNQRFSYSCVWEDWDRDGFPDLLVVNDFGRLTSYRNQGGTFVEDTSARRFLESGFGMGVTVGDFNRDAWMDVYIDNMFSGAGSRLTRQPWWREGREERKTGVFRRLAEGNALFINQQGEHFRETGDEAGVRMGRWSWGCAAPDLNNDGWEDLLVLNGFVTGTELDDL